MDDTTERELRASITDLQDKIAKLWTTLREVQAVLWGDNVRRDDGLKQVILSLEVRTGTLESVLRALQAELAHSLDAGREETCLGLAALAKPRAKACPKSIFSARAPAIRGF